MRERRRHLLAAGLLWDTSFNLTRITMWFSQGKEKNSSCEESYPVDLAVGVLMYFIYHWFFCPSLLIFSSHPLSASISVYLFTKWISSRLRNETIRIWITLLSNVRERTKEKDKLAKIASQALQSLKWSDTGNAKDKIVLWYYYTTPYMYKFAALL